MSDNNIEQKIENLGKIISAFAENEDIPAYLRWGLQVLFVAGSDSNERSNVVAGLSSVGERAFNNAIAKVKASGDLAGANKLENDKKTMLKQALAIDFAGAIASVLKSKIEELDEDKPSTSTINKVIVGIDGSGVVLPSTPSKTNPFAGRN